MKIKQSLQLFILCVIAKDIVDGGKSRGPSFTMDTSECSASNKTLSSYYCFIKSYSRTYKTLNFGLSIKRKVYAAMVIHLHFLI